MYCLRLYLNEIEEAELFSVSGSSLPRFCPHIPNGFQAILKTIFVIPQCIVTIRLSSKVLINMRV